MGPGSRPPVLSQCPALWLWLLSVPASLHREGGPTGPVPEDSAGGGGMGITILVLLSQLHSSPPPKDKIKTQYFSANLLCKVKMWKAIRRSAARQG